MEMEKYNNECLDDNDPLFEACKVGDTELVRAYLNQGGSAFAGSPNRPHLASIALQNGMIPIVEAMLNADLNVNDELNRFHERPLSYGVSRSHRPLIEFLLAQGGDVNKKNTNGTSIFAGACAKSPLDIVKLLFDAGGEVRSRNSIGRTPFQWAAFESNIENMMFLLDNGSTIDEADDAGTTPLIGCAKGGILEAATWLLDHGADINAKDKRGKTALDWAKANGHSRIVGLLQSRMGS
jgi:ankyrin repeat protein